MPVLGLAGCHRRKNWKIAGTSGWSVPILQSQTTVFVGQWMEWDSLPPCRKLRVEIHTKSRKFYIFADVSHTHTPTPTHLHPHIHTHPRTRTHTHAYTRTHTRTHTHTWIYDTHGHTCTRGLCHIFRGKLAPRGLFNFKCSFRAYRIMSLIDLNLGTCMELSEYSYHTWVMLFWMATAMCIIRNQCSCLKTAAMHPWTRARRTVSRWFKKLSVHASDMSIRRVQRRTQTLRRDVQGTAS